MVSNRLSGWGFLLALIGLFSCEEEFIPDVSTDPYQIVVEGYVEASDRPVPPYVILTRSVPFFSEIEADALEDLFIHGAGVFVSDGNRRIQLTESCFEELNAEQQALASALLGLAADTLGFNFCVYLDLSGLIAGEEGRTYELEVEAEGRQVYATTTIPPRVPLDSLRFLEPPGEPSDTLAQLQAWISDPPGPNYYRYFVQLNQGPFLSGINSVASDRLFDRQTFKFPLVKPEPRDLEFDPATFGLYRRGDTVLIKWASIGEAHYDFWNTLEFNAANQGPFSSYTRIDSNIEGGLGIWGGLSASYYEKVVPEK